MTCTVGGQGMDVHCGQGMVDIWTLMVSYSWQRMLYQTSYCSRWLGDLVVSSLNL